QKDYPHIRYVDFSRNFGKEIGMLAGFDYSDGDAVVVIDADLQQPPELIKDMIYWWEQGYDDVYAIRKERKGESKLKKWTSKTYYKVLQR
ncbi:glycosyltransferase, partial [Salmonella enterica]|uniref:glycosyltransferase n=1 Tax=Salmonella enterica TaxID=28901 RepID=UPI000CC9402B